MQMRGRPGKLQEANVKYSECNFPQSDNADALILDLLHLEEV